MVALKLAVIVTGLSAKCPLLTLTSIGAIRRPIRPTDVVKGRFEGWQNLYEGAEFCCWWCWWCSWLEEIVTWEDFSSISLRQRGVRFRITRGDSCIRSAHLPFQAPKATLPSPPPTSRLMLMAMLWLPVTLSSPLLMVARSPLSIGLNRLRVSTPLLVKEQ